MAYHGTEPARWRRLTAWIAVWAFLLASACSTVHHHALPTSPAVQVSHQAGPGISATHFNSNTHGERCLACLWCRAAVGSTVATGPHLSRVQAHRFIALQAPVLHGQYAPQWYLSRAPPSLSA